jgi:hypothetical protein
MRASDIALISAVLAIPSVGYAQQDNGPAGEPAGGPVGGPVGPEGSAVTGSSGAIAPCQVVWRRLDVDGVQQNVRIRPRADGIGSAFIKGQRVLVDLNTNRVLQQGNGPIGGSVGGPVGGVVGPEGSSSLGPSLRQQRPSLGSPYGATPRGGSLAGSTGSIAAGQVVTRNVPITQRYAGTGTAYINGQRVLVDTNTNRVLRPY